MAAIVGLPLAVLSGLAVSANGFIYCAYVATSILVIATTAAVLFELVLRLTGVSRLGMISAGALDAAVTAIVFVAIFVLCTTAFGVGPFVSGFKLYMDFLIGPIGCGIVAGGCLAGWVASAKRFSLA
jgi:hypothetical protein